MVDTMEVITMAKEQRMVMDMDMVMVMVMEVTMEATTMARDQLPKMTPPTTSLSPMVTSGTWKNTTNNLNRRPGLQTRPCTADLMAFFTRFYNFSLRQIFCK